MDAQIRYDNGTYVGLIACQKLLESSKGYKKGALIRIKNSDSIMRANLAEHKNDDHDEI